eukprot:augustus_masked-scaffold_81-processed-gene-0.48-mRNA-1 protein AED:1.00 eAED:1.00 QI:0/-1/0/0/-1/1/1/0/590
MQGYSPSKERRSKSMRNLNSGDAEDVSNMFSSLFKTKEKIPDPFASIENEEETKEKNKHEDQINSESDQKKIKSREKKKKVKKKNTESIEMKKKVSLPQALEKEGISAFTTINERERKSIRTTEKDETTKDMKSSENAEFKLVQTELKLMSNKETQACDESFKLKLRSTENELKVLKAISKTDSEKVKTLNAMNESLTRKIESLEHECKEKSVELKLLQAMKESQEKHAINLQENIRAFQSAEESLRNSTNNFVDTKNSLDELLLRLKNVFQEKDETVKVHLEAREKLICNLEREYNEHNQISKGNMTILTENLERLSDLLVRKSKENEVFELKNRKERELFVEMKSKFFSEMDLWRNFLSETRAEFKGKEEENLKLSLGRRTEMKLEMIKLERRVEEINRKEEELGQEKLIFEAKKKQENNLLEEKSTRIKKDEAEIEKKQKVFLEKKNIFEQEVSAFKTEKTQQKHNLQKAQSEKEKFHVWVRKYQKELKIFKQEKSKVDLQRIKNARKERELKELQDKINSQKENTNQIRKYLSKESQLINSPLSISALHSTYKNKASLKGESEKQESAFSFSNSNLETEFAAVFSP